MAAFSRRSFLTGATSVSFLALAGGLTGCSSQVSVSTNPKELVFWYWDRSMTPSVLRDAAHGIPGTNMFLNSQQPPTANWDTKLRTSLAGNAYIPDITAINSNVSLYFPDESLFVDMNKFGAEELKDNYFPWKWEYGLTPSGRMCFFPIDSGPTGFYYRYDIFAKAGLPSEPEEVSAAVRSWDDWIAFGQELKAKVGSYMLIKSGQLFNQIINASPERFFDKSGKPLYMEANSAVKQAWDITVKAIKAGVLGNQQLSTDQNAAWISGKTAGHIEAVWWAQILLSTAPATKGKWRLASQPVRAGNSGGSFLAIPHTCKDPEAAYRFVTWSQTAEHQAQAYNEVQLFPSAPAALKSGLMKDASKGFFGPQNSLDFFTKQAETVPAAFISTFESIASFFTAEITNVEAGAKTSDRAWEDAVNETNRVLQKNGVQL
ncbi:carbohydrate ABC transporter substrate-binding protein [Planctomonas sp. JC2975]|uniref:ABC transporter substrate-binding protein n=1 Tax=Planctomonas sp. JC2975 TaxID=2729626 RepID=UPI001475712C|nr:ABC transporter substrate-binding protein [Planctomonas sp. JC2975]NNC12572.1 carbohydrate ABC transporter substrate-binding protein [Planctomonas sp. JC2975]